jgi:uncharacterized membrane protein
VAINSRGQIAGSSNTAVAGGTARHAALWTVTPTGVTVRDLGLLPGGRFAEAEGINDQGQVVGLGDTKRGSETVVRAALWTVTPTGVTVQDLGALQGGTSGASGINGRGQVVGSSREHAVVWSRFEGEEEEEVEGVKFSGTIQSIDLPGQTLQVTGITVRVSQQTDIVRDNRRIALGDLKVGDAVEVAGTVQADRSVLAAMIRVIPPGHEARERRTEHVTR